MTLTTTPHAHRSVLCCIAAVALMIAACSTTDTTAVPAGDPVADDVADTPAGVEDQAGDGSDTRKWLFSHTARSGSMVEQSDGTHLLTLERADEHVTAFTDRPDRDSAIIPTDALVEAWPDLFAESAPNAVLIEHDSYGGPDSWVVVLTDPSIDGSTVTFTAEVLDPEDHSPAARRHVNEVHDSAPESFRDVSLFIDDVDAGDAANKSKFEMIRAA